jgi:hypothetical protein
MVFCSVRPKPDAARKYSMMKEPLTKRTVVTGNAERREPRRHGRRGWGPAAK